jgi:hypothetical protein
MAVEVQSAADGLEKLRAFRFTRVNTRSQEDRAASPALEKKICKSDPASSAEEESFGERLAGMGRFDLLELQKVAEGGNLGVPAAELRVTLNCHKHLPVRPDARLETDVGGTIPVVAIWTAFD